MKRGVSSVIGALLFILLAVAMFAALVVAAGQYYNYEAANQQGQAVAGAQVKELLLVYRLASGSGTYTAVGIYNNGTANVAISKLISVAKGNGYSCPMSQIIPGQSVINLAVGGYAVLNVPPSCTGNAVYDPVKNPVQIGVVTSLGNTFWMSASPPPASLAQGFNIILIRQGSGANPDVLFTERNLDPGTTWSVTFNGQPKYQTVSATDPSTETITFSNVAPGDYQWNSTSPIVCGSGCQFVITSPSPSTNVPMTVTALGAAQTIVFQKQYQLTVSVSPAGSGVTSPNVGIYWKSAGSPVLISATPVSGNKFSSWVGTGTVSYTGRASSTTITMNGAISQVAYFTTTGCASDPTVTFSESGLPAGTMWTAWFDGNPMTDSNPAKTFTVHPGSYSWTTVQAITTNSGGGTRTVYSSNDYGTLNAACQKSYTQPVSFSSQTQYQLTMAVSPSSAGTTSPAVGSHWYNSGASVSISATAQSGYQFSRWTGSGSGSYSGSTNAATVTMDGPVTETADFASTAPTTYTLTISVSPSGAGTVAYSVSSGSCTPSSGSTSTSTTITCNSGSVVALSESPHSGFQFYDWSGAATGSSSAASVTVTSNASVTANYKYAPSVSTLLSASSIQAGQSAHDSASLSGASADAGGTLTYYYTSAASSSCPSTGSASWGAAGTSAVTNGAVVTTSTPKTYSTAGTYWWYAAYSGDSKNLPATSPCEQLTVGAVTLYSVHMYVDPSGSGTIAYTVTSGTCYSNSAGTTQTSGGTTSTGAGVTIYCKSGAAVYMTSTGNSGWEFVGIVGNGNGNWDVPVNDQSCSIAASSSSGTASISNQDVSEEAEFGPLITVSVSPSNAGTVGYSYILDPSAPPQYQTLCSGNTGTTASFYVLPGDTVDVAESPAAGYSFVDWSGAVSGTSSTASFTPSGPSTATANFQTVTTVPTAISVSMPQSLQYTDCNGVSSAIESNYATLGLLTYTQNGQTVWLSGATVTLTYSDGTTATVTTGCIYKSPGTNFGHTYSYGIPDCATALGAPSSVTAKFPGQTINGVYYGPSTATSYCSGGQVTFSETGIPSGYFPSTWVVTLNNGQTFSQGASSGTYSYNDGTYTATASSITYNGVTYTASPSSQSFTISGNSVTVSFTYSASSDSYALTGINWVSGQNCGFLAPADCFAGTATVMDTTTGRGVSGVSVSFTGYACSWESADAYGAINVYCALGGDTWTASGNTGSSGSVTSGIFSVGLCQGRSCGAGYGGAVELIQICASATVNGKSVSGCSGFQNVSGIVSVSGLPSGTYASISFSPSVTVFDNIVCQCLTSKSTINSGTIFFMSPGTTYSWTITGPSGYTYSPSSGTFTSSSSSGPGGARDSSSASQQTPYVTFTESGYTGAWEVSFNGQTYSSSSSTITVSNLQSGTSYGWSVPNIVLDHLPCGFTDGYSASPASGSSTPSTTVSISFSYYSTPCTPSLSLGTTTTTVGSTVSWSVSKFPASDPVNVYITTQSGNTYVLTGGYGATTNSNGAASNSFTAGSNIQGTDTVWVQDSSGLKTNTVTLQVNAVQTYTVTFTESGTLGDYFWYVTFDGTAYPSSAGTYTGSIAISNVAAGAHSWSVSTACQDPTLSVCRSTKMVVSPSSGSMTVSGSTGQTVYMTLEDYVMITAGTGGSVNTGSEYVPDGGSVSLTATASSGYQFSSWSSSTGAITFSGTTSNPVQAYVNGPGTITANFARTTVFTVTFSESGLPGGTTWSATFNGATSSSTGNIVFTGISPGSYGWSVSTITLDYCRGSSGVNDGYSPSPSSGTVYVSGDTGQAIVFTYFLHSCAPPLSASASASPNSGTAPLSVTFSASASGGTGGYSYSWSGACSGSGSTCSRTFSSAGSYTAYVTVTDSSGHTASASASATVTSGVVYYTLTVSCGGCTGSGTYQAGTVVSISAPDSIGCSNGGAKYFSHWSGSGSGSYSGSNNPASVTMNGNITEYPVYSRTCILIVSPGMPLLLVVPLGVRLGMTRPRKGADRQA